jgi:glutamate/aspartate transport system substrate-binding protein
MTRLYLAAAALLAAASLAHADSPALDGRLKRIAATKTIALAYRTDATPFSFTDENKAPIGYTVDLCKRIVTLIEARIGVKDLQVKWVPVTSQNRFDAVAKGDADLECGASTVTQSRLKQVDFSSYVFVDGTGVLTMKAANIRSMADIPGKRVGVVSGTTNEKAVTDLDKRRALGLKIVAFKSREEAFAALEQGKVDAFASDKLLLVGAGLKAKDPKALYLLPEDLSFEPYAIALPRGDAGLRLAVNAALSRIYGEGEIGAIFGKWFGPLGDPTPLVRAMFVFGVIPE